jgi:hypothetical protein
VLQQLEEHRIKILKVAPHSQGQMAEQRGHTYPDVQTSHNAVMLYCTRLSYLPFMYSLLLSLFFGIL